VETIWTQEDIDALKAAILALATGTAVQTVTFGGPPERTVTYQQVQLPELRSLLAEVSGAVNARSSYTRVRWNKGFSRDDD
jgi:hypothetical protein